MTFITFSDRTTHNWNYPNAETRIEICKRIHESTKPSHHRIKYRYSSRKLPIPQYEVHFTGDVDTKPISVDILRCYVTTVSQVTRSGSKLPILKTAIYVAEGDEPNCVFILARKDLLSNALQVDNKFCTCWHCIKNF